MKRRKCPSCGLAFQRGRVVYRMLPSGPARSVVCQSCADLGVVILASDAPIRCDHCGDRAARFCAGCVAQVLQGATGIDLLAKLARGKGRPS
jgi:hypothetical protein